MIVKRIWYHSVKLFLQVSLHFFAKKVKIKGKENVPKKGAVLFAINHPNALMDPLFVTANNPRENHFLVRADVFKKPLIKKALASLNLMPIYRIRDGIKQLTHNEAIFNACFDILHNKETLIIFPQGGHSRERTIPSLSKGFTRIVFGALDKYKELDVAVIPVGVTYQNSSVYPTKVAVHFGNPIDARTIFDNDKKQEAITMLKSQVSEQLKKLTVHIPKDENYSENLQKLNDANVDFTEVEKINEYITTNQYPSKRKKTINYFKPLYWCIIFNSIIPFVIWKNTKKKIKDIEFVDTLKYGFNVVLFPFFYSVQSFVVAHFFGTKTGIMYLCFSFMAVLFYTKFAPTNTED